MRVLVTTTGGVGHIYPVVPIARAYRDEGHEVVWATSGPSVRVVERFGFVGASAGVDPDERRRRFAELHPRTFDLPPRERRPTTFAGLFAEISAPIMATHLQAIFDEIQPDLVVHEVAEMGAAPVATSRGVPRVVVAFSGVLPKRVMDEATTAVAPVWDAYSVPVPADLGLYDHDYLHPFPEALGQRPTSPRVRPVRPVAAEGPAHDDVESLRELGVERPLIYLTFGTEMGFLAPWSSLLSGLARVDADVVATTANNVDLAPLVRDLDKAARSRIHVLDYVPQATILERASLVVSHGGAGTMIAAGAAGVPQIVLPLAADQFDNAEAFIPSGGTTTLDVADLTPDDFAEAVTATLTSEASRRAAAELASQFAALPHPHEVITSTAGR